MSITTVITAPAVPVRARLFNRQRRARIAEEPNSTLQPRTKEELIAQLDASRARMAAGHYKTETEMRELLKGLHAELQPQK